MEEEVVDEKYKKIGGWLILLGIGIVTSCLLFFITIGTEIRDIINTKDIDYIFAVAHTMGLIIGWILILIASISFFKMKKVFINHFINMCIFILLLHIVVVCYLGFLGFFKSADPEVSKVVWSNVSALFRSIITSSIWIPYLLISKRAKNTFRY